MSLALSCKDTLVRGCELQRRRTRRQTNGNFVLGNLSASLARQRVIGQFKKNLLLARWRTAPAQHHDRATTRLDPGRARRAVANLVYSRALYLWLHQRSPSAAHSKPINLLLTDFADSYSDIGSGVGIRTQTLRLTDPCRPLKNGAPNSPRSVRCQQIARFATGVAVRTAPRISDNRKRFGL